MKKLIVIIALALPMLASAQKLGYINTQELFALMPEAKVAEDQIDSLQSYYRTVLTTMQEEYQKKYQDYQSKQATMTDAIRQISEEEIMTIQQRIQTTAETAQQDIERKRYELTVPIQEKMSKAIQVIGDREGFTYIFVRDATVYVGKDAIDLMPAVKKELGIK